MTAADDFVDDFFADSPGTGSMITRAHRVDVVLVAHDGARWLPRTLAALRGSTRRPDAIHVVDTESIDGTAMLLDNAASMIDTRLQAPRTQAFGASIAQAVEALPAIEGSDAHWIWVLHDDSAPAADALEQLLLAAEQHPDAWVLGAKSVGWTDSSRLQDVGLSLTGSGHRDPRIDRGERDQGQYWDSAEVLAVGSAGMLLRREVWQALAGMRPIYPVFRDDIDFCWRAWEHGFRVRVVPRAEIAHREAATHGVRSQDIMRGTAHRIGRQHALSMAFIHARPWARPLVLVRLIVATLVRALIYFFGKDARDAGDELRALFEWLLRPQHTYAEVHARGIPAVRAPRRLRPSVLVQAWHAVDLLAGFISEKIDDLLLVWAGSESFDVVEVDDLGDADAAISEETYVPRSRRQSFLTHVWRRPGTILFFGTLAISLVATRAIWGEGALQGGALLPVTGGAGELLGRYFADWHSVGLGSGAAMGPGVLSLVVWSWLFGGNLSIAVSALIVLAVPLAALSAHLAARPLIAQAEPRAFFAAAYALLPALPIAVANGRLGTVVFAIVLPVLVRLAWRCDANWQRTGGMALLVAFAAAWVPAVWLFTLVWVGLAAVFWRRGRDQRLRLAVLVLAPWAMLFPASFEWLVTPTLLLREAGSLGDGATGVSFLQLLLLHPGGVAAPWVWVFAGVIPAAIAALIQQRRRGRVAFAWTAVAITLAGYGIVWVVEHHWQYADPTTGAPLLNWPGPVTLTLGLGLLIALAAVTDGLAESLSTQRFGWRQITSFVLVAGVVLAPVLSAAGWLAHSANAPVERSAVSQVPPFLIEAAGSEARPRALVLRRDTDGVVRFRVADGRDETLGDAGLSRDVASIELRQILRTLLSGRDRTEAQRLAQYGIDYLVLADGDREVADALNGAVGLRRISGGTSGIVASWRVQAPSERLAIVSTVDDRRVVESLAYRRDGENPLSARMRIAAVNEPRMLVLAEPAGPWTATLAGEPLAAITDPDLGWRRAWRIPAGAAGVLEVGLQTGQRVGALIFAFVAGAFTLVLALPSYRRDPDDVEPEEVADGDLVA